MVLVTGGSGFLGGELVHQLIAQGETVRVLHRKHANLSHLKNIEKNLQFVEGDILDVSSLEDAFEGVDKVYHSAAIIGYDSTYYDAMYKTNVEGTANVVNAALSNNIKKLLHVSSIAAIGGRPGKMITEETKWEKNRWTTHYGITKMLAEREVWRGMQEGLEAVIVNPGIIVGVGHDEHKATLRLFRRIATGKLPFYTNGTNGFIDVIDTARISVMLMNSQLHGERYILTAENCSFKEYFEKIAHALQTSPPKMALNAFSGNTLSALDWLKSKLLNQKRSITQETLKVSLEPFTYSNKKIKDVLDYQFIPLEDTINRVAEKIVRDNKKQTL